VEQDQNTWVDEDQDESPAGELNAKHLEELYAKSGIKYRDHRIEEELRQWSHQSAFDFPIAINKQVKAYIVYFATERKGFTRRSLARGSRYLPMIKAIFQEYGLPEDLAYLAMVESGFNPNACSPAGACGMWQFIKGTGLRYGLVINETLDERRDPEKSTRAAARYLLDLYKQFGSWYLAAASYNCGEKRVQTELKKSNYKNFWELSANKCIPDETRNYVPQMIAATIIARNPKRFGFTDVPYQPPLSPQLASDQALAQVAPPAVGELRMQRPKPLKLPPALTPPGQARTAALSKPKPKPKTRLQAKNPQKTAKPRVCAVARQAPDKPVSRTRSGPYVASLFGYPHSGARQSKARIKRPSAPCKAGAAIKPKKAKSSPALFAKKAQPKPVHPVAKKHAQKSKFSKSKSKTKGKALLVSEAR
jgi:soluble lytic murein transglycosylase-like protein